MSQRRLPICSWSVYGTGSAGETVSELPGGWSRSWPRGWLSSRLRSGGTWPARRLGVPRPSGGEAGQSRWPGRAARQLPRLAPRSCARRGRTGSLYPVSAHTRVIAPLQPASAPVTHRQRSTTPNGDSGQGRSSHFWMPLNRDPGNRSSTATRHEEELYTRPLLQCILPHHTKPREDPYANLAK